MLFYICPDIPHTVSIKDDEKSGFLSVHFSYACVSLNEGIWDIRGEQQILPLQPAQQLKDCYPVGDAFRRLTETWNLKLPGYEFIAVTQLQQLLTAIFQNVRKQGRNYSLSLKLERIIDYMRQNVDRKVTLAELAELVQLAPTYLSRIFKVYISLRNCHETGCFRPPSRPNQAILADMKATCGVYYSKYP